MPPPFWNAGISTIQLYLKPEPETAPEIAVQEVEEAGNVDLESSKIDCESAESPDLKSLLLTIEEILEPLKSISGRPYC